MTYLWVVVVLPARARLSVFVPVRHHMTGGQGVGGRAWGGSGEGSSLRRCRRLECSTWSRWRSFQDSVQSLGEAQSPTSPLPARKQVKGLVIVSVTVTVLTYDCTVKYFPDLNN